MSYILKFNSILLIVRDQKGILFQIFIFKVNSLEKIYNVFTFFNKLKFLLCKMAYQNKYLLDNYRNKICGNSKIRL